MGMILILGKGDLAKTIHEMLPDSYLVGRPEYDFSNQKDCDRLVNEFDPTTVINTVGVNEHNNVWDTLVTNYISQAYLTLQWLKKIKSLHVINISSTSTYWPSWPDISEGRLAYNISKESLSQFGKHVNRMIANQGKHTVSTIELGSFASQFNNYTTGSMTLQRAATIVTDCVHTPVTSISCIK